MTCPSDDPAVWRLRRLMHAVQALAAPAEEALAVYPPFVCKMDELAIDFDHWLDVNRSHGGLPAQELELLERINTRLGAVCGAAVPDLWTEAALRAHPFWQSIRDEASAALDALGWPRDLPLPSPDTFVQA
jgi:hypothetical protein